MSRQLAAALSKLEPGLVVPNLRAVNVTATSGASRAFVQEFFPALRYSNYPSLACTATRQTGGPAAPAVTLETADGDVVEIPVEAGMTHLDVCARVLEAGGGDPVVLEKMDELRKAAFDKLAPKSPEAIAVAASEASEASQIDALANEADKAEDASATGAEASASDAPAQSTSA